MQDTLLQGAEDALSRILEETKDLDMLAAVGLPVRSKWDHKLYNCAAVLCKGELLGLVPKTCIPNYGEFYEARWFTSGAELDTMAELCGQNVPLSYNLIWECETMPELVVGVEICEDLWAAQPPSTALARAGATLILNLSASDELAGKAAYRRSLVSVQSGRLVCGYVYADAGEGESTTDLVFAGHNLVAENGALLAENRFDTGLTVSEIDVGKLIFERRRMNTFAPPRRDPMAEAHAIGIGRSSFTLELEDTALTRPIGKNPFVPEDGADRRERCEEIFTIAALGLKKRLEHTSASCAVVGLSGGLDSTLAPPSPPGLSTCWTGPGQTFWPSPCLASAPPPAPNPTPRCWPSASAPISARWTSARQCGSTSRTSASPWRTCRSHSRTARPGSALRY